MITLGINAAFHDSAAALVVDGVTVAAAEEERFTRIKHGKRPLPFSAWELPFHAIAWCLEKGGVTLDALDHVAYSFDPRDFLGDQAEAASLTLPLRPSNDTQGPDAKAWDNPWDALFGAYIVNAPAQLRDGAPHHLKDRFTPAPPHPADAAEPASPVRQRLPLEGERQGRSGGGPAYRWHFVNHHLCHQASAFLAAPFDRCAVMTLDGRGERATTTYGVYRDNAYRPLGEVFMPHSLGMLYERVTTHLGFLHSSDEYKVMALAALGQPRFLGGLLDHVQVGARGQYTVADIDLAALAGPARARGSAMTQRDFDLAASLQQLLEETVLQLATWLREETGERHLAMAGGVALNCVMNSKLRDAGLFDAVWIQPAAGDAGTALGAALWVDARERLTALQAADSVSPERWESDATGPAVTGDGAAVASYAEDAAVAATGLAKGIDDEGVPRAPVPLAPRRWSMSHAYLGPGYSDDAIEQALRWAKLPYRRPADLADATATLLAQDKIIGWFQGPMEFGPRALGARSFLASPLHPDMQQRLNELKDREDFRPVAPAVLHEAMGQWFSPPDANAGASPFMLFVYDVLPGQSQRIPSACHTDATARVQTVHADSNPRFHALLKAFEKKTGVPVLVNTSFNVRGEPIVCTPRDAIEAFYSTPLDALVIGGFIVEKG